MRALTGWVLVLLVLLAPPRAWAQSPDARQAARDYNEKAKVAFGAGDFEGAVDNFTRAQELFPDPRFRLNLGVALENLGRLDDAEENYQAFLRSQAKGPKADAVREKVRVLQRAMKEKGKLIITVDPSPDVVEVDRVAFKRLRPVKVWLTPGTHAVVVTRQGYQPQTLETLVKAGVPGELGVTLKPLGPETASNATVAAPEPVAPRPEVTPAVTEPTPAATPPPSPAGEERPSSARKWALLGVGGVGGVLTVGALLAAAAGVAVAGGIFGAWNTVVGLDRYRIPLNVGLVASLVGSGVAAVLVPLLLGAASAALVSAFVFN